MAVPLPQPVGARRDDHRLPRMDGAGAAHLRAHRRHRQLLLPRAVVPEGRRARGRGLELPPVPRGHRVLLRLRRLRRAADGAEGLGGRRHRRRARGARQPGRHDDAPLLPGGRARLRVDDEPRLRRAPGAVRAARPAAGRDAPAAAARARGPGRAPLRGDARGAARTTASGSARTRTRTSRSSIPPGRAAPAAWSTRRCSRPARGGSRRPTSPIPRA